MLEINLVFPGHVDGGTQVGGANHHVGQLGGQRVADEACGFAGWCRCGREAVLGRDDAPPVLSEATLDTGDELLVKLGILLGVVGNECIPILLELLAAGLEIRKDIVNLVTNNKVLVGVHAELGLDVPHFVNAEGGTVGLGVARDLAADSDGGADIDEGGLLGAGLGLVEGLDDALDVVVAVQDVNDVPAVGAHSGIEILDAAHVDAAVASDLVVVVDHDQVVQLPVAGQIDRLLEDTFLRAGVANHDICGVVDEVKAGLVVGGSQALGGHGQTDSVGHTLAKRTGGDFNALVLDLGVAGGEGVVSGGVVGLQLVHGHLLIAREVEEGILEQAGVAV